MDIVPVSCHMGEAAKPQIYATGETHREARVTKAKLGLTWDEFVAEAAEELDPDFIPAVRPRSFHPTARRRI